VLKLTGSSSEIGLGDPRKGDIQESVADIGKIAKIGWKHKYSLEKGLKETIAWFRTI